MPAAWVGPLRVPPSISRTDTGIIFEIDMMRQRVLGPVPILKGILTIPNQVISINDVVLPLVGAVILIRQGGVVDLP